MPDNEQENIPFFKPNFCEKDFNNLQKYFMEIKSGKFSASKHRNLLKNKLLKFLQLPRDIQCVFTKSGTLALYLALLSIKKINNRSEVLVPNVVCPGVINAIICAGFKPIFIDVDDNANIDPEQIVLMINSKLCAVLAVHYGGYPCQIIKIQQICKTYNLILIEDCAQSLGAKVSNHYTGVFGDIAIFSFYANKIISCGEGGAVIFNNNYYGQAIRNANLLLDEIFIIDPLLSIICYSQIDKIDSNVQFRTSIANQYDSYFTLLNKVKILVPDKSIIPSYYQYVLSIESNLNSIIQKSKKYNIQVYKDFIPNHYYDLYKKNVANIDESKLKNSIKLSNKRLTIPCYPTMPMDNVKFVFSALSRLIK